METPECVRWLHANEMCGRRNYITWPSCFGAEADGPLVCGHCGRGPLWSPNQEGVIPTRVGLARPQSCKPFIINPKLSHRSPNEGVHLWQPRDSSNLFHDTFWDFYVPAP